MLGSPHDTYLHSRRAWERGYLHTVSDLVPAKLVAVNENIEANSIVIEQTSMLRKVQGYSNSYTVCVRQVTPQAEGNKKKWMKE